ncbi:MAG: GYF domain-containing protein [Bdellovibrionaceae bacterium]|nr:GYF domain-containing protein [Pseudobdellovibrionaceae bacterium]
MEWFVLKNGDVLGPYETNSVAQMFGSEADVLIWGVPHQEWLSFTDWARKMNMGAVAQQSSSFRRGHSQVHHSQASQSPVSESYVTPAAIAAEPSPVEQPQRSTHREVQQHQEGHSQSTHSEPVVSAYSQSTHSEPIVSAYSQPTHSSSEVPHSGASGHVSHDTGSSDFNPDATAVYVQPTSEVGGLEDDGRTMVSTVDLPLEIPAEEDVDNVIPLRQEATQEPMSHSDSYEAVDVIETSDSVQEIEDLLDDAQEQLVQGADIEELLAEAGSADDPEEAVAAKPTYVEDQGTVDIEQLLEEQSESFDEHADVKDDEYAADEEGATRVSASLSDLDADSDDEEEGATRVSASLSDLEDDSDEEEGATRVSASLDLSDLEEDESSNGDDDLASILGSAFSPPSGEDSDQEGSVDEELDLSFDGQTQVSESQIDMASLLDSDVQARGEEEGEDHNFDFDGVSQVIEDATRVDSLMDMENVPAGRESEDEEVENLEWSGQSATEEATRVFMDDLAHDDAELSAESEEATRVQGSSVEDENDEHEEATRVQASEEDDNEARLQALLNDIDDEDDLDDGEGATRVSASTQDLHDIDDLEDIEDIEGSEDELFEAFSIEDDEAEGSTRVSASLADDEEAHDEEEGATRVSHALGVVEHSLVATEEDQQDEDDLPYELDASELDAEAEEEEATRVNASESSVEENLSEFEEEITRDVPVEALQEDSDEEGATRVSASGTDAEQDQDSEYDLEGATRVEDLKVIAHKMNEEKRMQEDFVWYIAYEGESEGPLTLSQVMKSIDDYEIKDFIYLWREGFIDWKNLFDVPELSSGLGIGFRRHSRIQATGTVSVEFEGGVQIGQLDNLSESGIGMTGVDGLHLGDVVKVKLDADDFDESVMLVARVRFVSETGLLGLSYEKDKYPENVTKVIDFVKANAKKAAA